MWTIILILDELWNCCLWVVLQAEIEKRKKQKRRNTHGSNFNETTSWGWCTPVSYTHLLAGGTTLEPNNKTAKTTVSKGSPVTITLGVVKGVKIKIDNQEIDTSKLTGQTGWITLKLGSN